MSSNLTAVYTGDLRKKKIRSRNVEKNLTLGVILRVTCSVGRACASSLYSQTLCREGDYSLRDYL